MNIAIVGATGLVGSKIVEVLVERKHKFDEIFLFASAEEKSKKIKIYDKTYRVLSLEDKPIEEYKIDCAFFAVDAEVSKKYVPLFANAKIFVIDNSNAFRRDEDVPLVVPQVNGKELLRGGYIFANPNCSTIQLVTALKPLQDKFGLKRVVVSTYQAVSGGGSQALQDLKNNTKFSFNYPICNNILPQIDIFLDNGYTKEEDKVIFETRKILNLPDLKITATAVRVPIEIGHSESVNVELENSCTKDEVEFELRQGENIVVIDQPERNKYPMPLYAAGRDEVFVGRIRVDESCENAFNMWVVADNLRRGAASNAVDIFESLIKMGKL